MTRVITASALLGLLLMPAPAAPAPKGNRPPPTYYPTKPGDTWVMAVNGIEFTSTMTAAEPAGGGTVVTVEGRRGGQPRGTRRVRVDAAGVFRLPVDGPPECLFRAPLRSGDTWAVDTWDGQAADFLATAHGAEDVTVPAGQYKAVRVTFEGTLGGPPVKLTYWFAPGVGVVRQVNAGGLVYELKSFTPGKD